MDYSHHWLRLCLNSLGPDGTKPLPEPIFFLYIQGARDIHPKAFIVRYEDTNQKKTRLKITFLKSNKDLPMSYMLNNEPFFY